MTATQTNRPQPKYRKNLNPNQIQLLQLLYRYRFVTSQQIAKFSSKPSAKSVQKRLKILEDQSLIAKRYDKSYKLKGQPAAYYLLPKGARLLDGPVNIKRIYKDKDVSQSFIRHCINILDINLYLKAHYDRRHDEQFKLFTKIDLNFEKWSYFPQPLPDAYLRLKTTGSEKLYFLDMFEDTTPFFVLVRRLKKYLEYSAEGDWEESTGLDLPTILMVFESTSTQKRLRKAIARQLQNSLELVNFATTTIDDISASVESSGKVWHIIDEDGDDPEEPQPPRALGELDFSYQ